MAQDYRYNGSSVELAGFADLPTDTRSACIGVLDARGNSATAVEGCRELGAPVILICQQDKVEWWQQTTEQPEHQETIAPNKLDRFFEHHRKDFGPDRIFRAKTIGRFDRAYQLSFVDIGLMPLVESEIGDKVSRLVGRVVKDFVHDLKRPRLSDAESRQIFKSVFWLLAAKILHDKKNVENFKRIDLLDFDAVFDRVAKHYAAAVSPLPRSKAWRSALDRAAQTVSEFAHLGNISTEALAYVYENTLIDKALRQKLGTHSTPSYLVDYILWQLSPWISEIEEDKRHIFEPACGHGAFLVGAMRLLRFLLRGTDSAKHHRYLKAHVRGIEIDPFALELARLSLTLADIPNPNGWRLTEADMFESDILQKEAKKARILLANPPFEAFTSKEKARYRKAGNDVGTNKAIEMLERTIAHLPVGAVFGVVVPQGVLHNKQACDVRRQMASEFELSEICLFPDKMFKFSDMETTIILGRRRRTDRAATGQVQYRRVRESGMSRFRESYTVSTDRLIPQVRFLGTGDSSFRIPELENLWDALDARRKLSDLASMGQGLAHKGKDLPEGAWTIRSPKRKRDTPGFADVPRNLQIWGLPEEVGVNVDSSVLLRMRAGLPPGEPQVLLNYAPVSRGPWRLKAIIDSDDHAVTSRFIAIRPSKPSISVEFLWALLNSPVANAFAYCHLGKRDNLVGTMGQMPAPDPAARDVESIVRAACAYRRLVKRFDEFMVPDPDESAVRSALLAMDAEVLRLYDLPPRLERELLDLFAGKVRKGVGCTFKQYFPADFTPFVPLHEYLSDEYRRSTAGEMRKRHVPVTSPNVLQALDRAVEAFGEE
ncbi:MAG: SAM-dependent DNA methyltransferase [Phycisphaerales bacterium]|nr:MAG: SAM-dependent DNA methyltransferase [Phycisphaerales bacterium]